MPPYTVGQVAKTWVTLVGAAATALLGVLAGDTTAGAILTVVAAVGTVVAVYAMPNAPTHDAVAIPPVYVPEAEAEADDDADTETDADADDD